MVCNVENAKWYGCTGTSVERAGAEIAPDGMQLFLKKATCEGTLRKTKIARPEEEHRTTSEGMRQEGRFNLLGWKH